MTVSNITPVNNYTGNGTNKLFDFDFPIEDKTELVVTHISNKGIKTKLICDLDYTINIAENGENNSYGQSITFPIPSSNYEILKNDEKISLSLSLPIEQQKEIKNSNKLNLSTLEWCLDYLTRIAQIQNRQLERAIKVQEGSNIDTDVLTSNLNKVADNLPSIYNALNYANNANIWAEGSDLEIQALGGVHSAKGWAESATFGQVQCDWDEDNNEEKSYILNKPTKLSDFNNDLPTATTSTKGLVKVDGSTVVSDDFGTISVNSNAFDLNYTNKNLSNISQSAINNIMDYIVPDYVENGTPLIKQTVHQISENGYLTGIINSGRNAGCSFIHIYDENDTPVKSLVYGYSANDINQYAVFVPLYAGLKVKIAPTGGLYYSDPSGNLTQDYLLFVPMKGAN